MTDAEPGGVLPPHEQGAMKGDLAHTTLRASLSMVPFVGGPLVEYLGHFFASPREKRIDATLRFLLDSVTELQNRGADVTALKQDDEFCNLVLDAVQAAMRTHHDEKRRALKNAVLNTGLGKAPDEIKRHVFVGLVDRLTTLHLRVLRVMSDPRGAFPRAGNPVPSWQLGGSIAIVLQQTLPNDRDEDLLELVIRDLKATGLTRTADWKMTMTPHGVLSPHTTKLGDEFLRFIDDPA